MEAILQGSTPQRSTSVSTADEAEICGEGLDGLKKKTPKSGLEST